jgi:hypothetical protein
VAFTFTLSRPSVLPTVRSDVVSPVAQKVFDLGSWNFTILVSKCSCAPGVLRVDLFSICRVIALDLIGICNFQLVSPVAQKVFDLGSWNYTGMLLSICRCAHGILLVDKFYFVRVIVLDLIKLCYFQNVPRIAQKSIWPRVNKHEMLVSMCRCAPWYNQYF